jgi:hypothetical protein
MFCALIGSTKAPNGRQAGFRTVTDSRARPSREGRIDALNKSFDPQIADFKRASPPGRGQNIFFN